MMLPASAIDILSFSFASSDRRTVACSALDGHGAGGVDCCSMMYVVMCLTRRMMSASQPHIHTMGKQFLIPELKNLEEEPSKSNTQTETKKIYAIIANLAKELQNSHAALSNASQSLVE